MAVSRLNSALAISASSASYSSSASPLRTLSSGRPSSSAGIRAWHTPCSSGSWMSAICKRPKHHLLQQGDLDIATSALFRPNQEGQSPSQASRHELRSTLRVHPAGHAFARVRMVKRMSGGPALASSGGGGRLLRRRRQVSETWT